MIGGKSHIGFEYILGYRKRVIYIHIRHTGACGVASARRTKFALQTLQTARVTQFLIEKKIHVRNFQILICA
jgi:hypothetical protein